MTYRQLYEDAMNKLDHGKITVGEYEKMIEPLDKEIEPEPPEPEELDFVQPHKKVGVRLEIGQPEIIRCKKCKHGSPDGKYGCRVYHYKRYETHDMKPDDFCSFAKRREE